MCARRLLLAILLSGLAEACAAGPSAGESPMRSPTLDYPDPAVETADGRVLGADGVRVEDKLRSGPRIGTEGVVPSEGPAKVQRRPEPEMAFPEDPLCKVLGVRDVVQIARCSTTAKPKP